MLDHFGPEASAKLNLYSCQLEDALLEALAHQKEQAAALAKQSNYIERVQLVLRAAAADRESMLKVLTDPDQLADYVEGFYGPNGPHPVATPQDQAQASIAQNLQATEDSGNLMPRMENPRMDGGYERPAYPSQPAPGAAQGGMGWNEVSQAMDTNPGEAWKMLATMSPDEVRRKVLFMEA